MADSRRKIPVRDRLDDEFEDDDDLVGPRSGGTRPSRPAPAPKPRRGKAVAKRGRPARSDWIRSLVSDIPSFGKLLWGLARDPRVSKADKGIVVGVLVYAALPADIIPDWIPGLGEMEDLLLVALALSRLLTNAGEEVLLDHWDGETETLEALLDALDGATEFLPGPVRGLLGGAR